MREDAKGASWLDSMIYLGFPKAPPHNLLKHEQANVKSLPVRGRSPFSIEISKCLQNSSCYLTLMFWWDKYMRAEVACEVHFHQNWVFDQIKRWPLTSQRFTWKPWCHLCANHTPSTSVQLDAHTFGNNWEIVDLRIPYCYRLEDCSRKHKLMSMHKSANREFWNSVWVVGPEIIKNEDFHKPKSPRSSRNYNCQTWILKILDKKKGKKKRKLVKNLWGVCLHITWPWWSWKKTFCLKFVLRKQVPW